MSSNFEMEAFLRAKSFHINSQPWERLVPGITESPDREMDVQVFLDELRELRNKSQGRSWQALQAIVNLFDTISKFTNTLCVTTMSSKDRPVNMDIHGKPTANTSARQLLSSGLAIDFSPHGASLSAHTSNITYKQDSEYENVVNSFINLLSPVDQTVIASRIFGIVESYNPRSPIMG